MRPAKLSNNLKLIMGKKVSVAGIMSMGPRQPLFRLSKDNIPVETKKDQVKRFDALGFLSACLIMGCM